MLAELRSFFLPGVPGGDGASRWSIKVMMKGINVATGRELPKKLTLMFEFVDSGTCDCPQLPFFSLSS
jgi:hypothetical protein